MLGDSLPSPGFTPGLQPEFTITSGEVFGAMFEDTRTILPWMQTRRAREYFLEGKRGQSMRGVFERQMGTDELNDKYGIEGHLKFDVPMTEERAILKHEWKTQDLEREEILSRAGGFWNGVTKFGASIVSSFADPIMLGAMFTPAIYARMTGAVSATGASLTTGQFAARTLASEAAINGITEAWAAGLSGYADKEYNWGDAAISTVFGTAIGVGTGMLGKMRYDSVMGAIGPQARAEIAQSVISDLVEGKATSKAEWRIRLDPEVLKQRAVADVLDDIRVADEARTGSSLQVDPGSGRIVDPDTGELIDPLIGRTDADIKKLVDERIEVLRQEELAELAVEQRAEHEAQLKADEAIKKPDENVRRTEATDSEELTELEGMIKEQEENMGGVREGEQAVVKRVEAEKSAAMVEHSARLSAIDCVIGSM